MKNTNRNGYSNKGGNSFGWIATIVSKGFDCIRGVTNTRCDSYAYQSAYATNEMHRKDISRRERKYWSKQNDKAQNGLKDVHEKNCNTVTSILVSVAAIYAGYNIFKRR